MRPSHPKVCSNPPGSATPVEHGCFGARRRRTDPTTDEPVSRGSLKSGFGSICCFFPACSRLPTLVISPQPPFLTFLPTPIKLSRAEEATASQAKSRAVKFCSLSCYSATAALLTFLPTPIKPSRAEGAQLHRRSQDCKAVVVTIVSCFPPGQSLLHRARLQPPNLPGSVK